MTVPPFASATEQARLVARGEVTSRELVDAALQRISALDPRLNAFVEVVAEEARADADALDALAGPRGPLHGVPVAIKDENDVIGLRTTYGGGAVERTATQDSAVVRRLRETGAVVVGKTRMPEFGIWPFTESVAGGITRNPWDTSRSTAGSSGGTAAAVASAMVPVGIGGDGGGSIRLPAAWCGLFGLKPQRGRVSCAPNDNLWRALGTIGPLTRTVADSAVVYDVIAEKPFSRPLSEAVDAPFTQRRIAVTEKNPGGFARADRESLAALHATAAALRALGHDVVRVDKPRFPVVSMPFLLQVTGGVSDEAARVDRPDLLEGRTRTMLRLSKPFLRFGDWAERTGADKADAFLGSFFGDHDLLLMPTVPTPAVPVGQLEGAGLVRAMSKAMPVASFTSLWNVLGNPAAAIPSGFSSGGLPLSVQLVGPTDGEPEIIEVAAQLERVRPWAERRPAGL